MSENLTSGSHPQQTLTSLFGFLFVSVSLIHGFSPQVIKTRLGIDHWNLWYFERSHLINGAATPCIFIATFIQSVLAACWNCGRGFRQVGILHKFWGSLSSYDSKVSSFLQVVPKVFWSTFSLRERFSDGNIFDSSSSLKDNFWKVLKSLNS